MDFRVHMTGKPSDTSSLTIDHGRTSFQRQMDALVFDRHRSTEEGSESLKTATLDSGTYLAAFDIIGTE